MICSKVNYITHLSLVFALLTINQMNQVHCAHMVSSWPSMKTHDIWGSTPNNDDIQNFENITSTKDILSTDYVEANSLRNGRGIKLQSVFDPFVAFVRIYSISLFTRFYSVEFFRISK